MKTQEQAPLWEALLQYRQQNYNSWHTPGHKDGGYTWLPWRQALGAETLALDLTEVPGLDNLACPAGAIKAAQDKAAAFYGAARSFFLVNGSSSGLAAVFLATCRPGDEVLLPRYAHRAVFNGLILCGARPVYLETEWLAELDLPLGVTPATLAKALKEHPRAKLLLLVHPTYEGIVPHCQELIELAHAHGLTVLADAAHGAHFGLTTTLPPSPLTLGADFVVQSTHKTLAALTQAAMLHLGDARQGPAVAEALNLLQTTSPSYLLMASLDTARLLAQVRGTYDWARAVDKALEVRGELAAAGMPCLEKEDVLGLAAAGLDLTRLVLPTAPLGASGGEVAAALREIGQEVELAAAGYILLIITPGDSQVKIGSLMEALLALSRAGGQALPASNNRLVACQPQVTLSPREAWMLPRREMPLQKALGSIAAELIAPCPPGLALVVPGEVLTGEVIAGLVELRGRDGRVQVVET